MRLLSFAVAGAFAAAIGPAFAQGPMPGGDAVDQSQAKAIDDAYRGRCEAKVSKELCSCVIAVGNASVQDPAERQVFFDFMMGDVDKAKSERAMFPPEKNIRFNVDLQRADAMLGERCDKLKKAP